MKKLLLATVSIVLTLSLLGGCAPQKPAEPAADAPTTTETKKIVIGASPTPHAEILEVAKQVLAEQGYELEIKQFDDYILPNLALSDKDLDANFFQHQPYLDNFNAENKTTLVSIAKIHYEPFGIYPGKVKTIADLQDGGTIAVPNDTSNEARALLLLEAQGLIKVTKDLGLQTTINDITENPKNIQFKEIEAAQISRSLADVDLAVINGNYALQAGLDVNLDAIAKETSDSIGASTFPNIVAVRAGDENREDLKALVAAIQSPKVKAFIEEKYKGAVVPLF